MDRRTLAQSYLFTLPAIALSIALVLLLAGCRASVRGSGVTNTLSAVGAVATELTVSPSSSTLAVGNSATYSISGGDTPYSLTYSGAGTATLSDTNTISFTAPGSTENSRITITDEAGSTTTIDITVNAALSVSPNAVGLEHNGTYTFSVSGGVEPITLAISNSASGSFSDYTFTAPSSGIHYVVGEATDSIGNTANFYIGVMDAKAWFDADDVNDSWNSGLSSNDSVGRWVDKVSGIQANAAGGGQEPYITRGAVNSHDAVRFESANSDCLILDTEFLDTTSNTIALVGTASGTGSEPYFWDDGATNGFEMFRLRAHNGLAKAMQQDDVRADSNNMNPVGASFDDGDFHIIMFEANAAAANPTGTIWVDGTTATNSGASYDNTTTYEGATAGFPSIGGDSSCGGNYLDGNIAELIIFGQAMSSTEEDAIHCYLYRKFGISVSGLSCD